MSRRAIFAIVFILIGVGAIGIAIANTGSAVDYVKKHYKKDGTDGGAQVYLSPNSVSQTVKDITNAEDPGDRRTTESGVFLRYPKNIIGVLVNKGGGSKVEIADERTGYNHFYTYLGGFWGIYTGPAGGFRGGGPGAGK